MSDTDNIRQEFEQYICDNIESEVGVEFALQKDIDGNYNTAWVSHRWGGWQAATERATAIERERCAKVCESRFMGDLNREDMEATRCAAAIRQDKSIGETL